MANANFVLLYSIFAGQMDDDTPRTTAMVSSSMGPINSLLDKLPAEPQFAHLTRDLNVIRQHLLTFNARGVAANMLHRQWMKQLRELAYDIEDWIDKLVIQSGGQLKLDKLSWDDSNSDMLQEFKVRIADMQELGKQFSLLKVRLC